MYEAYSEPCQTSKMLAVEHIFAKHSILDVWQGSEYAYRLERFLIWHTLIVRDAVILVK